MEFYTVTVPPTVQPVTLAEAKSFMKVNYAVDDAMITGLIVAATEKIESYTGQYFIVRTVQGDFSSIYMSKSEVYPWVKVRRAPLKTITSVQISIDGSFIDENYQEKKHTHGFSRILFPNITAVLDDIPYPLQIIFTAGYGLAVDVPENIKLAIKEYVNFLYRNRGDCIDANACKVLNENSGFPPLTRALIQPYKIVEVYA